MKFKIGDTVKIIAVPDDGHNHNDVGVIVRIEPPAEIYPFIVKVGKKEGVYDESELKLYSLPEVDKKFKDLKKQVEKEMK